MERKPQQQTLSIRISDSLRQYLERSKEVISEGRDDSISISDVAKILLESARSEPFDHRMEVAQLGERPTESLIAIRKKWEIGQPRSRAEWLFMAQYIQIGCEWRTGNPMAPGYEPYVVLLEALLAVRGLRQDRGLELDRYYLGLLRETIPNDRKFDADRVPTVVAEMIADIRRSKHWAPASAVGRAFFAALRDEDFQDLAALNRVLAPYMNTLFRLAARGHWIKEEQPLRLLRDPSLLLGLVPTIKHAGQSLRVIPESFDVTFEIEFAAADLVYCISSYAEIREFIAMLKALAPRESWSGLLFTGVVQPAYGKIPVRYQFQRNNKDTVKLGFNEDNWEKLKTLCFKAMEQPEMQAIFSELSMIYGEL